MTVRASVGASWRKTARLAWDVAVHAPGPTVMSLMIQLANGSRSGLYAWVTAGIVNGLVDGHGALPWAGAFAAVTTAENLSWLYMGPTRQWLRDMVVLYMHGQILARASQAPLLRFADPQWVDGLERATRDLAARMGQWLGGVLDFIGLLSQVCGLLVAVLLLGGGIGLLAVLLASSLWAAHCQERLAQVELDRTRRSARPRRLASAWAALLSTRASAAEIRLYHLGDWVRSHWERSYHAAAVEELRAARRRLGWDGAQSAGDVAAYLVVLGLAALAGWHAGPARAAGVLAALLEASLGMQGFFGQLLRTAGGMHTHSALVADLMAVLGEEPGTAASQRHLPTGESAVSPVTVAVDRVRLRYPAAVGEALQGVSVHVNPGEIVALVGPNGAGKSTLAAVILGLLEPTAGTVSITVPGSPYAGEVTSKRPRFSAVFQDFVRFTLRLRDNVGFGALEHLGQDRVLHHALEQAGSSLAGEDLELWLGPEFGGRDISGGEWLRVAIARGIVGQSGLLVLDEPTAAMDPVGEVALVERMLTLGLGRTVIIVSHRLGIARYAQRIVVLRDGQVVEEGTHSQLLDRDGLYAQMWRAQAAWYGAADPRQALGGAAVAPAE